MTYDEMIAVIQAAKAGKRIQARIQDSQPEDSRAWGAPMEPNLSVWNFNKYDYRVVPEPQTYWVPVDRDGKPNGPVFDDESKALAWTTPGRKPIKLREVTE